MVCNHDQKSAPKSCSVSISRSTSGFTACALYLASVQPAILDSPGFINNLQAATTTDGYEIVLAASTYPQAVQPGTHREEHTIYQSRGQCTSGLSQQKKRPVKSVRESDVSVRLSYCERDRGKVQRVVVESHLQPFSSTHPRCVC